MQIKVSVPMCVWCLVGMAIVTIGALDMDQDSSCTQIDFDEATVSSLRQCGYMQEFIAKRYDDSSHFDPYREDAVYYLSHRWQGLTCGETVNTYAFNAETELRMAYNLVFDSGATLEVRVFDEERTDPDNKPTLVEYWSTTVSTDGYFREKLNKTVKQARIQIEANINAGSDLAIEYLTIFNYEVETEECSIIDEFSTTTAAPSTTSTVTTPITTTIAADTTTQQPDTTSTVETTTTTSTSLSTDDVEATSTTEVTQELSTISLEQTTTTIAATTEAITTTTNGPRDDTSMQPSSSTTEQPSSSPLTSTAQTMDSSEKSTTELTTTQGTPASYETISPKQWLWMTLTALFAILFVLAASAAIYLCFLNQHLERLSKRLLDENSRYPCKR